MHMPDTLNAFYILVKVDIYLIKGPPHKEDIIPPHIKILRQQTLHNLPKMIYLISIGIGLSTQISWFPVLCF